MFFDSYSDTKSGALGSLILLALCIAGGLVAATLFFCACCARTERRTGLVHEGVTAGGAEETSLRSLKTGFIETSEVRFVAMPSSPKTKAPDATSSTVGVPSLV